ncbi:hypothetical protein [Hymenobacter metallicola]|uniref:Uncharacterized protein n=1 Tax=Hymenobacter metallicola TaxID=2563114 RepID=A0A4Z0QEV0_9BACT|nr:hypothetical protein [Hymenobacter metallicola]TGE28578.1 hypothetical protein E5K02_03690 [Hymenobacter metallicola]
MLSPYKVVVDKECRSAYQARNSQFLTNRAGASEAKRQQKEANLEQYTQQPFYTRKMFENELAFIDSLTLRNYVAYVAREYIAHRLYRPYKIKPRLVLVSTATLESSPNAYKEQAEQSKADFIVNFPVINVKQGKAGLQVQTVTELYSRKQSAIVLKDKQTGTLTEEPTEYPMYEPGQPDWAFVHSVYENIRKCIVLIAESRK